MLGEAAGIHAAKDRSGRARVTGAFCGGVGEGERAFLCVASCGKCWQVLVPGVVTPHPFSPFVPPDPPSRSQRRSVQRPRPREWRRQGTVQPLLCRLDRACAQETETAPRPGATPP